MSTPIHHNPVNDFNADQTRSFLIKSYTESLANANNPSNRCK